MRQKLRTQSQAHGRPCFMPLLHGREAPPFTQSRAHGPGHGKRLGLLHQSDSDYFVRATRAVPSKRLGLFIKAIRTIYQSNSDNSSNRNQLKSLSISGCSAHQRIPGRCIFFNAYDPCGYPEGVYSSADTRKMAYGPCCFAYTPQRILRSSADTRKLLRLQAASPTSLSGYSAHQRIPGSCFAYKMLRLHASADTPLSRLQALGCCAYMNSILPVRSYYTYGRSYHTVRSYHTPSSATRRHF